MIRKSALALVLSVGLFASIASANIVVGKVDVQKVLVTVKQGVAVKNKLKKVFDKRQEELKKGEDKIRKMQADFQKQSLVMSGDAKAKKEQELMKKMQEIREMSVKYQKEIYDEEQKLKKPILERIRDIITEVSKSAGVDLTFEASTAPIVYAKKSKDLTDEVIKMYDKKHK